ncbi:MAG: PAS domain S-box protein [Syntrophomonadaceae bacterium]|nr:PAS domain S-box protein [Syntrophomonadaceae bacterium]
MDTPIRVLILEESEANIGELLDTLRAGGFSLLYERASTPEDMITALQARTWDIIIANINMGAFSEQPALKILKAANCNTPCLVVAEELSEAQISQVIKDGAHDYIPQGNLGKLVPAIKIAIYDHSMDKLQRQAEKALNTQNEWFRVTLSSIGDGVVTTDVNTNITYMNRVAEEITGYSQTEAIGRPISEIFNIFNELTLAPAELPVQRVIEKGFIIGLANHTGLITKDGSTRSIADSAAPIRDTDGEISGVVMVFRDITESKKLEEHLARLDKLNVVGQMAAGIAHEIRNPMTIVRGYLQLLMLSQNCADYKDHFGLMIGEIDRANSIITGFLSLAKERVEKVELENLNEIVRSVTPLIQAEAVINDKYVELDLQDVPDRPLYRGDIHQLILNFARNGLEASPPGSGILIKTYVMNDKVYLAVQDYGPGIEPEIFKKLGSPFITTKSNGTGLGLAICYNIAEKHGAVIDVQTSNQGTTFSIGF